MNTLESIAQFVAAALRPLADALDASDAHVADLLALLGWELPDGAPEAVLGLRSAAARTAAAVARLRTATRPGGAATEAELAAAAAECLAAVLELSAKLNALEEDLDRELSAELIGATALPSELVRRLLDWGVAALLRGESPGLHALLLALGIVEEVPTAADPARYQPDFVLRRVRWDRIPALLTDPAGLFRDLYGWGESSFQTAPFHDRLRGLAARTFSLPVVTYAEPEVIDVIAPGTSTRPIHARVPIRVSDEVVVWIGAMVVVPDSARPAGIALTLEVDGSAAASLAILPGVTCELSSGSELAAGLAIALWPDRAPEVFTGISGTAPAVKSEGAISVALTLGDGDPGSERVWLRVGDGSELTAGASLVTFAAGGGSAPQASIEWLLRNARLVVVPADGLVGKLIPAGGLAFDFDLGVGWSTSRGVYFVGGAALDVTIPLDLLLFEAVELIALELSLAADSGGLHLSAGLSLALQIGPIAATVERIGLRANATLPAGGGRFGPLELTVGFLPPTGLGIGVDIEGIVTGGGFLSFAPDEGRYAGVAALQMLGVGLTAIGIVETERPEDPNGWSMFLSVMADFTPVPLGFGFFLSGVGGFMGLHRTLDEIALAEGVREGRIDSLLFPEDPLADALRIIADIEAYFPARQDTHAFGAMARIDWGVPALISGELGVVLVVPDFRVAVVGEVESILPSPTAPLIELHMGVVGYVDPAEATFWVTASIYDSRLVQYALSGDMAMYAALGEAPYFLLSVGGFHPDWAPPQTVPSTMRSLRRMTAAIDLGTDLQVGLDAYFAVTSNTLQFGAEVFAVARAREIGVDFSAEGSFGFDVLVIFTPFSLVAGMKSNVSIKAEGETVLSASVSLHLEGPKPWYGRATASFEFLKLPVDFHVAIGGKVDDDAPDSIELWLELEPALRDPESWSTPAIAAGTVPDVTLRPLDAVAETGLWLAPDGALELRQRVLPLDQTIEVFGAFVPEGESRFEVEAAGLASGIEVDWEPIADWFAPAQFVAMTPTERLSAPSFEKMEAGVSLSAAGFAVPDEERDRAAVDLDYEELVLEDTTRALGRRTLARDRFGLGPRFQVLGAIAPASRREVANLTPFRVAPARYDVADALDGARVARGATFANAVVARRGVSSAEKLRPRIVPVQSMGEIAA